jgi:Ala-tRNA(Pro) deacylase
MSAPYTETELIRFLSDHQIDYRRVDHPAIFTCDEAKLVRPDTPGVDTKNLFLRDEKHNYYLVMTACEKRLNLKTLGRSLRAPKLQMGTSDQLMDCLGLTPGSVTILGLVNDHLHRVQLVVDDQYWPSPTYLCHPLVNTATLVIDHAALERFLAITGHLPKAVQINAVGKVE